MAAKFALHRVQQSRRILSNSLLQENERETPTSADDRQRAQALIEEITVRSYDWDTKQVLKKLLDANEKIIELECILKDSKTQSNQIEFLKVLLDAGVDQDQYMNLNLPMRQVIVKQCRAVNARLNELKTIINKSERPKKEELLFEAYKIRDDKEAYYDEDDPKPKPSSDEDKNVTNSKIQHSAPLSHFNFYQEHKSERMNSESAAELSTNKDRQSDPKVPQGMPLPKNIASVYIIWRSVRGKTDILSEKNHRAI